MPRKFKRKAIRIKTAKNENSSSAGIRGKKLVSLCGNDVPGSSKAECKVAQRILMDISLNPEKLTMQDILDSKSRDTSNALSEKKHSAVANQACTSNVIFRNEKVTVNETHNNSMDVIEDSPPPVATNKNKIATPFDSPETLKALASKKICMEKINTKEETPDNSMDVIEDSPPPVATNKNKIATHFDSPETLKALASKKICMEKINTKEETPDNSLDVIEDSPPPVATNKNKTATPLYSPETLKNLASKKKCMERIQSIAYDLTNEDNLKAQAPEKNIIENNTSAALISEIKNASVATTNTENLCNLSDITKSPSLLMLPADIFSTSSSFPDSLKKIATKTCMELICGVEKNLPSPSRTECNTSLEEEATGHSDSIMMYENVPSTSRQDNVSLEDDLYLSDDSVADPDWEDPENKISQQNRSDSDLDIDRSPKKIKTSRWHKRKEESYDRNKQKHLRSQCLPYRDYKKKLKPPKAPREIICTCKYQCSENFSQKQREEICKTYWNLQTYSRQKDFLLSNIIAELPKTILRVAKRRRTTVRSYFFTLRNATHKVCEKFFKATLCISNGPINKAFTQIGDSGTFQGQDLRGKHEAYNKTGETDETYVKEHIESFPTVESHYCRKTSSKLYLQSDLSISKMYQLYKEKCDSDSKTPVSINVYRRIFCTQYNLDFHKPKNDQCLLCNKYKTAKDENLPDLEVWKQKYDEHLQLRDQSQTAKEADKKRANDDEHFNSITIDLQKVLHLPSSSVSLLYYLRKLNVYNATIYEAKSPNDGYCYLWTELDGRKGADEVATALYLWIKRLPNTVTEISIFSDTCAAQNRNQYLVCLLLYLVQKTNLQVIEHKYLESGHSHMEVDSMHSAIEHQMSKMSIFSITDLCNVIRLARSNRKIKKGNAPKKQYEPILMAHTDILDVKDLANNLMKNRKIGRDGEVIQWLKVKCFRFEKARPNIVQYKYDYTSEYKELNVTVKNKNLRKRKQTEPENIFDYNTYVLKKAYDQLLPITKSKKKDLLKMCSEKIIPRELHSWYENLPVKDGRDYISDEDE